MSKTLNFKWTHNGHELIILFIAFRLHEDDNMFYLTAVSAM